MSGAAISLSESETQRDDVGRPRTRPFGHAVSDLFTPRPERNAAIDGLRAVAVTLVVITHVHAAWLPDGSLGVDVFFVISGYVITKLLLTRRPALRDFYVARWRRLMPALTLMVVVTCLLLATRGADYRPDIEHSPLALTYTMDFYKAAHDHGAVAGGGAFAHIWSLAVEEQFYLVWPLLLGPLLRVPARQRAMLLGGLCVAVLAERVALVMGGASYARLYFAPDTRADQLLAGCALACLVDAGLLVPHVIGRLEWLAYPAALGLLGMALTVNDGAIEWWWWEPGQYSLTALLAVIVIAVLVTSPRHPLSRVLAARPVVAVGTLSYGIYLWHYPVLRLIGGDGIGDGASLIIVVVTSATLAFMSWWLVEARFGRRAVPLKLRLELPAVQAKTG